MHACQQLAAALAVCQARQCLRRPFAGQLRQTVRAVGLQQQPVGRDLRASALSRKSGIGASLVLQGCSGAWLG